MVERTSLDGAVSIVTGAGGDIGSGIATELASAGSDIVIADVDVLETAYNQQSSQEVSGATRAQAVVEQIEDQGQRAHVVECNVTKPEQVDALIDETVSEFGGLDLLVNNAGIITVTPVEEMAADEWDSIMDVNAKGVFLVSKAAIPHLRESEGSIINTASIAGDIGAAGLGHYCASKHAVLGLTKSLSLELAPDVTVNAICPGIVQTPMWEDVLTPELEESYEETIERVIPMGRDQTPDDMGRLAVFLAENRNITGQAVTVDGGILQNVI
ncbi:SDR family NAD(P)-dependent oxidoreductase [Natronorubrum thiooxidans]|nr:SDR family NAD(P)-dependent oxidoreductase [Natronorubrum thiooxidans]